jgi:hypothetical protein
MYARVSAMLTSWLIGATAEDLPSGRVDFESVILSGVD